MEKYDVISKVYKYLFMDAKLLSLWLHCSAITDIVIPYGVTSIRDYTFYDCYSLSNVTIPDSVTTIGDYAFRYCSALSSVEIPDSVTSIPDYAFCNCSSLRAVTLGSSVTSIGYESFYGCYLLTNITIPSGVDRQVGIRALQQTYEVCNLSSLNITAGSTSNGYVAYYAKNVYSATSGESKLFTTKEGYMFYDDGAAGIWKPLYDRFGLHIDFAHRTFRWDSEASLIAHVHCVIIGFSLCANSGPRLICDADGTHTAANINPYLTDAPTYSLKAGTGLYATSRRWCTGTNPRTGDIFF